MVHSGARSPLDVGTVIAGTYTIERVIGKGGMGAVFLASHARLPGKKVAIKVLHADVADSESLARFRREAEIASRLGHANIVEVHDFNELPDGTPYLVLEYLDGESLAQRLARGPMALEPALAIVRQVGSALAAAHHQDIIHRDLKPANVFLVAVEIDGNVVERAKVLDFGISKIRGSTTIKTQEASILGTPQYMSPEQALGNHAAVDGRTDVFALGAMVYEMLSGRPAFGGASVPEVVFKVVYEEPAPLPESLPAHVTAAITKALAKKADERWPSVEAFVEALTGAPRLPGKRALAIAPGDGTPPDARTKPRETGDNAYAQTIGSGDHAVSVAETQLKEPPPSTIPTVSQPPRGLPMFWIAFIVLVLAGAAVAIVFLVTRKDDHAAPQVAALALDAGDAPAPKPPADAAAPKPPVDAAAPIPKPPPPADAGAGAPRPTPTPKPHPDVPKQPDSSLPECEADLANGDDDEAMRCANAALLAKPGLAAAYVIKAKVYCDEDDQENAQTMARKLHGVAHGWAITYCGKKGITLQ